jgi:hypothetical protein
MNVATASHQPGTLCDPASLTDALAHQTLVLGDQAPWAGGLLRAWVARTALQIHPDYYLQDLDTPWCATSERLAIKNGWNHYWSLACRYPWSFSVPGASVNDVLNTTQSPHGLAYLVGPKTDTTIYSQNACPLLGRLVPALLQREVTWAGRIAQWSGLTPPQDLCWPAENIRRLAHACAEIVGIESVQSFFELFRASPPWLYAHLPDHLFWHVTPTGTRLHAYAPRAFPVPRGRTLILEIAARGWVLGCTHLPYVQDVLHLRDHYLPGLIIRLLLIAFDWDIADYNPMHTVLAVHNHQRKRRGKLPLDGSTAALAAIEAYWRKRPSSISYHILGGRLNPRFQLVAL